jgi:hypothetical protein
MLGDLGKTPVTQYGEEGHTCATSNYFVVSLDPQILNYRELDICYFIY